MFSSGCSNRAFIMTSYPQGFLESASGNNTNPAWRTFKSENDFPEGLKDHHYKANEELSSDVSQLNELRDKIIFKDSSSPLSPIPSKDENIHSKVEMEAKSQGYSFDDDLMVYINEDGEGKTWDDIFEELQNKPMFPGCQPIEEINNSYAIPSELEKEKISLITKHLLNFNIWLEGLSDAGWQISCEGGFAFDPQGTMTDYNDLIDQFPIKKKQFLAHLEAYGFYYDEKTETIFNGKTPATFVQVAQIVKDYLPADPHSEIMEMDPRLIQNLVQNSNKEEILNILAVQLQFEKFLFTLVSAGGNLNYAKKLFILPDGSTQTFKHVESKHFLPMQEQFLSYVESQGYTFNFKTQELTKGNLPATVWQAELLKTGFHQSYVFPNFDAVKSGLKPLMNYSDFIRVLESKGFKENSALYENWIQQRDQTILTFEKHGFKYDAKTDLYEKDQKCFTLDQLYDTMKKTILKLVVERADAQLGMLYDSILKCFKNEFRILTTEEVLLEIMIQDFGL